MVWILAFLSAISSCAYVGSRPAFQRWGLASVPLGWIGHLVKWETWFGPSISQAYQRPHQPLTDLPGLGTRHGRSNSPHAFARDLNLQLWAACLSEACLGNGISGGLLGDSALSLFLWNSALLWGMLVLDGTARHCRTPSSYPGPLPERSQERVLWAQELLCAPLTLLHGDFCCSAHSSEQGDLQAGLPLEGSEHGPMMRSERAETTSVCPWVLNARLSTQ